MEAQQVSKKETFEENLGKLEGIMSDIEKGELGLEESISRFEDGLKLIKKCRDILDGAELRINKIISGDPAQTEPFKPLGTED